MPKKRSTKTKKKRARKKASTRRNIPAKPKSLKPTEVTDSYWLDAESKKGGYSEHTENGGRWLIFVPIPLVDEVWERIKQATEEGKLGNSAKVSTGRPNPNAKDPTSKVICVYTYDWTDKEDVRRVREELRRLGITQKIPYKADNDALTGKYANRGSTRISKYYE
jgi:hypothetical protein